MKKKDKEVNKVKSNISGKKGFIFIIFMISITVVLAGVLFSWSIGKGVEVTRYFNLENQYDKPVIIIIIDGNRGPPNPFIFKLNNSQKIENKKMDISMGSANPYYDIGIKLYENTQTENENFLLDEIRYIMELDYKNEQIRDKEQINLEYYIKILSNGTINFDLESTRKFDFSEKILSEKICKIHILNNITDKGYSQIIMNNILVSNISLINNELWYNISHYGSISDFNNNITFKIYTYDAKLTHYKLEIQKIISVKFKECNNIYVNYNIDQISIEYL